jgi:hypothetical protein
MIGRASKSSLTNRQQHYLPNFSPTTLRRLQGWAYHTQNRANMLPCSAGRKRKCDIEDPPIIVPERNGLFLRNHHFICVGQVTVPS